jgi:hypothetical protein
VNRVNRVVGAAALVMALSVVALILAVRAGENLAGRVWAVLFVVAFAVTALAVRR